LPIAITGGPGSGKTTLLRELERLGYRCVPEVARQIIQEQVRSCGDALPWGDRETYTRLMLERSVESYPAGAAFCDRGIPDTLGYARLIGLRETALIKEACRRYRYAARVLVAPPWREIYSSDTERKQDFDEALLTFSVVTDVYRECGYELLELPRTDVATRVQFVEYHFGASFRE